MPKTSGHRRPARAHPKNNVSCLAKEEGVFKSNTVYEVDSERDRWRAKREAHPRPAIVDVTKIAPNKL